MTVYNMAHINIIYKKFKGLKKNDNGLTYFFFKRFGDVLWWKGTETEDTYHPVLPNYHCLHNLNCEVHWYQKWGANCKR